MNTNLKPKMPQNPKKKKIAEKNPKPEKVNNKVKIHKWNQKETEILIATVKKYPTIWDTEQYDKENYSNAWSDIVKVMGINDVNEKEAKRKWTNLYSTFQSCLKKLQNPTSPKNGENAPPKSVLWTHFKKMLFVDPNIESDKLLAGHAQKALAVEPEDNLSEILSSSSGDCVVQDVKMESPIFQDDDEYMNQTPIVPMAVYTPASSRCKQQVNTSLGLKQLYTTPLESSETSDSILQADRNYTFCNYILSELNGLSDGNAKSLRHRLNKTMFQYLQNAPQCTATP